MKLKANDTLHISALGPDNIAPGQEFEVSDHFGKDLVKRRLAVEVKSRKEPANKKAAEPANKEA